MDTSEAYIKMCDCPEIQEPWNQAGHDFTHRRPGRQYKHGTMLWLPRQDQLQEMFGDTLYFLSLHFACFVDGLNGGSSLRPFTSYEQLWLAFVMKEKHSKTWNGQEWVS